MFATRHHFRHLAGTIAALATVSLIISCGGGIDADLASNQLHVADLTAGEGPIARDGDHVLVNLASWTYADGEKGLEVDYVGNEKQTVHLAEGAVMPGLREGIIGMHEGGKRLVVVGPEKITSEFRPMEARTDEALWVEVELVDVVRVGIEDLTVGDGDLLAVGDYVEIEYTGWHAGVGNKKDDQFISSSDTEKPAGLLIGSGMVNAGIDQGLIGMRVGGERRLIVPPSLAYGDRGKDGVRPGATLVYEVTPLRKLAVTTKTISEGSGAVVRDGDKIAFHLRGWIRNEDGSKGELFQDSYDQANPYTTFAGHFRIQPGLELGLRGMKRGEIRQVDCPADLAFGTRGWHRGDRTLVPPDTDVIYELEVVQPGL